MKKINPWQVTGYKQGQNVSCKVNYAEKDGYSVTILKDNLPGFIRTANTLKAGDEILGVFVCVHQGRILLSQLFSAPRATAHQLAQTTVNWEEHQNSDDLDKAYEQQAMTSRNQRLGITEESTYQTPQSPTDFSQYQAATGTQDNTVINSTQSNPVHDYSQYAAPQQQTAADYSQYQDSQQPAQQHDQAPYQQSAQQYEPAVQQSQYESSQPNPYQSQAPSQYAGNQPQPAWANPQQDQYQSQQPSGYDAAQQSQLQQDLLMQQQAAQQAAAAAQQHTGQQPRYQEPPQPTQPTQPTQSQYDSGQQGQVESGQQVQYQSDQQVQYQTGQQNPYQNGQTPPGNQPQPWGAPAGYQQTAIEQTAQLAPAQQSQAQQPMPQSNQQQPMQQQAMQQPVQQQSPVQQQAMQQAPAQPQAYQQPAAAEEQWQSPHTQVPTKRFRLRRAIDLVMPPVDQESLESLKSFKIADYDMEWLITDLEGGMRTGCIKATSEQKLSRSAALLYRGRAVGCIYGCKANPDAKPTEESLSAMLSDLEAPDAIVTLYDLPEDVSLSMSALFLGYPIDNNPEMNAREYCDFVMKWFGENGSTACLAVTVPQTKSTYLVFVHKGKFGGFFFVEEQQFSRDANEIITMFNNHPDARIEASILNADTLNSGMRFGYSLSMARQKRSGF